MEKNHYFLRYITITNSHIIQPWEVFGSLVTKNKWLTRTCKALFPLRATHDLTHSSLTTPLGGRQWVSISTLQMRKWSKERVSDLPKAQSWWMAEPGFEPKQSGSRVCALYYHTIPTLLTCRSNQINSQGTNFVSRFLGNHQPSHSLPSINHP